MRAGTSPKMWDVTEYRWWFYQRALPSEREKGGKARTESVTEPYPDLLAGTAFDQALHAALQWADVKTEPAQTIPSGPSHVSRLIKFVDWTERLEKWVTLQARTLLDVYYLQIGQEPRDSMAILGPSASSIEWPSYGHDAHPEFLGSARCVAAQSNDGLNRAQAAAIMAELGGCDGTQCYEVTVLKQCYVTRFYSGDFETLGLLYSETTEEEAKEVLNEHFPALLLSRVKRRRIENRYTQLAEDARLKEDELDNLLRQAAADRKTMDELEKVVVEVSRKQTAFIEATSKLEEHLHTLEIARGNLERLIPTEADRTERSVALRIFTSDFPLLRDQLEADIHYFCITQRQADVALQSLQTVASVRGAQWERRMTGVLGLFAVLGLAQVFPEPPFWAPLYVYCWRFLLVLAGATVVAVIYHRFRRL